jgi:hypothetical protein
MTHNEMKVILTYANGTTSTDYVKPGLVPIDVQIEALRQSAWRAGHQGWIKIDLVKETV